MSRTRATVLVITGVLFWTIIPGATQSPSLTVVSASPAGEIGELADADQIRVVFSEAMVALGAVPSSTPPPWIHLSPAVPGSFYWSGTKTLMFSPDASTPLPFATRFTVRVDAAAASITGRALSAPYEFTFTTPTPRLVEATWYRNNGRFDGAAVIGLLFNQPMRAADVVAHVQVTLTPHVWQAPAISVGGRERLQQTEPTGLERFDEKVAAVARVTASSEPVAIRAADSWDEQQFSVAPERVVVETIAAPPTDAWLTIALDDRLPGVQGRERHAAQSTVVRLEPTFFVIDPRCTRQCDPWQWFNEIGLTRPTSVAAMARALSIADVTNRAGERPLMPAQRVESGPDDQMSSFAVRQLGFEDQPPARTWRFHVAADLAAADGQTLGYPWAGFVETGHAQPLIGLDGTVWEAGGGPRVPVTVLNVGSIAESIVRLTPASVMPRLQKMRDRWLRLLLPRVDKNARLTSPDVAETRPLDVRRASSPAGTGIFEVALSPASPRTAPLVINVPDALRSIVQVTNLGISVKDSPVSTLVFVTRLDSGAPVPGAAVAIVDRSNRTRWRGTTDRDGVAMAPALDLRRPSRYHYGDLSFIVTAEKDGDEAFVASDWNADLSSEVNYDQSESPRVLHAYVFTDRGVYKAAETVHLKAIVRDDTTTGVRLLPAGTEVGIIVRDSRRHEVDRRILTVNRWSSAEWTWLVPDGAALGDYAVDVVREGGDGAARSPDGSGSFLVAAFRRPDFRVDATLSGDPAVLGSTLQGVVNAKYLFGEPLGARPVRWSLRGEAVRQPPEPIGERYPADRWAVGYLPRPADPERGESSLLEKTEVLGADGGLHVSLPTAAEDGAARSYTFEADVEDASGQHIANRTSLVVHPASLYVALSRPPTFVETRSGATVGVVAVDWSGTPVADVPVTVSDIRRRVVLKVADTLQIPVDATVVERALDHRSTTRSRRMDTGTRRGRDPAGALPGSWVAVAAQSPRA